MSRKITIVKKNLAPAPKPPGVNPRDPWSSFSEASEEQLLMRYLNSRGINPNFVSKDTKISHSKSSEFIKWKNDHQFMEQVIYEGVDKEDVLSFDIPLFIRILELAREDVKEDMELHRITERLLSIRKKGVLTMDDYEFIAGMKKLKEEMLEEGVFTDDESIAKHLVKKYGKNVDSHQIKLAHHFHPEKHKTTPERIANHVNRLLGRPVTEEEELEEGVFTDDESIAKHLVKKHGKDVRPSDIKLAMHFHPEPHKTNLERIAGHVKRLVSGPKPVTEGKSPRLTVLDKFRKASVEREKKHNEIEKTRQEKLHQDPSKVSVPVANTKKDDMSASIDRLEKHLNKESSEFIKGVKKKVAATKSDRYTHYSKTSKDMPNTADTYAQMAKHQKQLSKEEVELEEASKDNPRHPMHQSDPSLYKKTPKSMTKNYATHAGKFFSNKDTIDFTVDYKKTDKEAPRYKNEEVEQIDEISKSTLSSYKDKSTASMKNAQANRDAAEPGKNMSKGFADLHAKSDAIVNKRVKGLIGYMQRKQGMKPTSEDVYQDSQAATQTVFDGANSTDDTTTNKKRGMSKSARMIKALYKHHKMVKEDMYDHEKEDKSVQTYGKKPKFQKPDEENNKSEDKPAAVMTGGTTLTGEKRDEVEIDPMMKNRPGQNQFNKEFGKKGS